MDLAADVAKEKFVQKIIDFEKVPSVSVKYYINQTQSSYAQNESRDIIGFLNSVNET